MKLAERNRSEPQAERVQARRELEVARKREGILHAAARAFARGGYHATTMQDIAREAGYTPPSLYAYFAGKEQIFTELAALLSREFVAVFDEPVRAGLSFPERLEVLLRQLFEKAERHRDAVTVFLVARLSGGTSFSQGMAPESNDSDDFSSVQLLTSWLRRNATRRELGEQEPEKMGVALAGLAHAFCIQWLAGGSSASTASLASEVASQFLYGAMGVGPGAPKRAASPRARKSDKGNGAVRPSERKSSRSRAR
jgi:AcrR family transcriptional regulator